MLNLQQMAMNFLQQNPQISNSPQGREFLRILQTGDAAAGEQMASNILSAYGLSKEQGVQQAKTFFNL